MQTVCFLLPDICGLRTYWFFRPSRNVRQCFLSNISDFLVNHFLDILYQFITINDYLHFSTYFRQSKILSDIRGVGHSGVLQNVYLFKCVFFIHVITVTRAQIILARVVQYSSHNIQWLLKGPRLIRPKL